MENIETNIQVQNEDLTQNQVQNETYQEVPSTKEDLSFIQEASKFMNEGGIFMWVILAVWVVGVSISLERLKSLFKYDIDSNSLMAKIRKSVLMNEVQNAINNCSGTKSLVAHVLRNGLKRANQTKDQIKDALESTILEIVPLAEKRLNYIALFANVSTLLGLLGTIQGLIASFSAVANADPSQKAQMLAYGISTAMNTTALGLLSGISLMVVHSFLQSKSEKIISESEEYSVKLLDILSTKKGNQIESFNNTQEDHHTPITQTVKSAA